MSLEDTIDRIKSGVYNIVFIDSKNNRLGGGTCFLSLNYLITNSHVARAPNGCRVWIRRNGENDTKSGIILSQIEFNQLVVSRSEENNYDFAILNIPNGMKITSAHNFRLSTSSVCRPGQDVAFIGYPFEHLNITCHRGTISSLYKSGITEVIQIDGSVNPSNSGGPLFIPETGEVICIITRKETGLTRAFSSLRATINSNISLINNMGGDMFVAGVSYKQTILSGQRQILLTLGEIERQANVGIGYAFSIDHLKNDNIIHDAMQKAAADS
ncbi:S1 family peptidase [Inquilinus sp. OTU3971]|uniref:S1 family peptidase n=1 Tax=Inquilinus sp. OTU3971 TaxID=3043855 RepID=UPI00313DE5FB